MQITMMNQQTVKKRDQHILVADGVPQLSLTHRPAHPIIGSPGLSLFGGSLEQAPKMHVCDSAPEISTSV
jgi:hypothetical protein